MGHNTYMYEIYFVIYFIAIYSLKAVIDRPTIEDREFAPLSELQGVKLLPGAVSQILVIQMYNCTLVLLLHIIFQRYQFDMCQ